jgi:hypothetical protein
MYRATHLFFETPAERDAAEQEALAAKDSVSRKLNYPALGEEKKQLNSICLTLTQCNLDLIRQFDNTTRDKALLCFRFSTLPYIK